MANLDKMPCKYETFKDLHDRLEGCIVLYRDFPYMTSIQMDEQNPLKGRICLHRLDYKEQGSKTFIEVKIDDPDLDISSTDLGYLNWETHKGDRFVVYSYRTTAKRFKQALFPQYISCKTISGEDASSSGVWTSKAGFDFFVENYPSVRTAFKLIDEWKQVAISRDVAMRKLKCGIILIYLRTKEVAWINPNDNVMYFSPDASWVDKKYVNRFDWSRNGR